MAINFQDMSEEIFEILQRDIPAAQMRRYATRVTKSLNRGESFEVNGSSVVARPLRIRGMLKAITVQNGTPLPKDYLQAWDIGSSDVGQYSYVPWSLYLSDKKDYDKYKVLRHGPTVSTDGRNILLLSEKYDDEPKFIYYAKNNDLNFDNLPDYDHNWVDENSPDLYVEGIIAQAAQQYDDEARRVEAIIAFARNIDLLNQHESAANFHNSIRTTRRFNPPGG